MKNKKITTNLTIGYILALVVLTALLTVEYVVLREVVSDNVSSSALVNISGRQRMHSQRIVLLAQELALGATTPNQAVNRKNVRDDLIRTIEMMEQSHDALVNGNVALRLPNTMSKTLKVMYFGPRGFLDKEVRTFLDHARAFSNAPFEDMVPGNSNLLYLLRVGLGSLLSLLDDVVSQYEMESVQRGALLERTQELFFVLTLFTVVLTALVIFRPMVSRIERDLAEQEEAERELRGNYSLIQLLHRTASEANMAESVDEAFRLCLASVCEHKGWSVGHAYIRSEKSPGRLSPTDIWCLNDEDRFAKFRGITSITEFERGVGLPGRVLATGQPSWITDVNKDTNFPRARLAKDIGVKAGFALPVLVGSEVAAVLEFFSDNAYEPDDKLLGTLTHIGTQLGRVVERIRAETALRESERIKANILETALDGIVIMDADGKIVEFNSSAENTFAYTRDQALGKKVVDVIFPPGLRERYRRKFKRHIATGKGWVFGNRIELTAMRSGGSEFPVEMSMTVTDLGEHRYYTAFIHDIAERRQAEKNERRHRSEMAYASRLSTMGEMAAGLAHELNQPLSALNNYARGCMRRLADGNMSGRDMVSVMEKVSFQADRASKIIHWLRGFVSKEEPKMTKVDINAVLITVIEILRSEMLRDHIVINLRLGEELPCVTADRVQVEQVLVNLLLNGMEAMLDNDDGLRRLGVGTSLDEDRSIRVSVRDSGPGISEKALGNIFSPFFTTKEEGMGLGLSVCQSVIESHGGRIWVDSDTGKGAEFNFTLPIVNEADDASA